MLLKAGEPHPPQNTASWFFSNGAEPKTINTTSSIRHHKNTGIISLNASGDVRSYVYVYIIIMTPAPKAKRPIAIRKEMRHRSITDLLSLQIRNIGIIANVKSPSIPIAFQTLRQCMQTSGETEDEPVYTYTSVHITLGVLHFSPSTSSQDALTGLH